MRERSIGDASTEGLLPRWVAKPFERSNAREVRRLLGRDEVLGDGKPGVPGQPDFPSTPRQFGNLLDGVVAISSLGCPPPANVALGVIDTSWVDVDNRVALWDPFCWVESNLMLSSCSIPWGRSIAGNLQNSQPTLRNSRIPKASPEGSQL